MTEEIGRAIATIILALGGAGGIISLVSRLYKLWTNRKNQAFNETESADSNRRKALEYASELRRQLTENGIKPKPWPKNLNYRR